MYVLFYHTSAPELLHHFLSAISHVLLALQFVAAADKYSIELAKQQQGIFEVTRRSYLTVSLLSATVAFVKIFGESEQSLRLYDQWDAFVRRVTGR